MAELFPDIMERFSIETSGTDDVTIKGFQGGSGPALLLIHGFPQTNLIWAEAAHKLVDSYTLVIPDIRGYGTSSKPVSSDADDHSLYAKSRMAADMVALMARLGHESYFVVGHDRGGRIAHKLCIDHPEQVKKVMFLDIVPTLTMFEAVDQEFATKYWHWFWLAQPAPFPESAMTAASGIYASKMLKNLVKPGTPEAQGKVAGVFHTTAYRAYALAIGDHPTARGMCEDYRAAATIDLQEQRADIAAGRKIKCPVRALWGNAGFIEKKFNAREDWQKVSEQPIDPRSRPLDSGHYIPEEVTDELCSDIREFCQ